MEKTCGYRLIAEYERTGTASVSASVCVCVCVCECVLCVCVYVCACACVVMYAVSVSLTRHVPTQACEHAARLWCAALYGTQDAPKHRLRAFKTQTESIQDTRV